MSDPTPDDTAACCDLDPRSLVSALWFDTLPYEAQRAIIRASGRTVPFTVGSPHHYDRGAKHRPGNIGVQVFTSCFSEQLHGTGMRLVIAGCEQRWRRPLAWVLCAECGRAEDLGRPPRGWPRTPPTPRHVQFFQRAGWHLGRTLGCTTVMRGLTVRATHRIEDTLHG
jgi:hypothetical protein